jgi:polyisoprenoid-binding protein YceI
MMTLMKYRVACVTIPILAAVTTGGLAGTTYRVVPEKSSLRIEVGKGGAFGFVAGHTHEVEGRIQGRITADMRDLPAAEIQLTIRAGDLRVSGKGEPPGDVPKVQERMLGPDVLDVARFPEITFRSTSVAAVERRDRAADLRVTGDLTLHGRTKSITAPVRVQIDGGSLTASGTLTVKQTDFGITPVSVGGVVNVKDALTIHFTVTADRDTASASQSRRSTVTSTATVSCS